MMTPERFEALAEAYGGDVARWPAGDRVAASRWADEHPAAARRLLAGAAELDAVLDAAPALRTSSELVDRILAGAPRATSPARAAWWLPAGMGAGLAAACAAGVLFGQQLSQAPLSETDAVLAAVSEGLGLYADEGA